MRIQINLASQPYEYARRFVRQWTLTLSLLLLVTLALVIGALFRLKEFRAEQKVINNLRAQIAQGDKEIAAAQAFLNRPENRDTRDKSEILNELIARKAFSWTQVFTDLEKIMPPRLHVVSIHPELTPDNQLELKISVAGESRDRALDLVRKMEQSQRFREPQVVSENSEQQGQNQGDAVQYSISALYIPELPASNAGSAVPTATSGGGE